jgi:hypothetical protein
MDIALALRTMVVPTQRDDTMLQYLQPREGQQDGALDARREWVMHLQVGETDREREGGVEVDERRRGKREGGIERIIAGGCLDARREWVMHL